MTDPAALTSQVAALIEDVLQVDVPAPDTDLVAEGLIDSLALVSLITEVELEFGIQLPIEEFDLNGFRSAEQIAAVVAAQLPAGRVA